MSMHLRNDKDQSIRAQASEWFARERSGNMSDDELLAMLNWLNGDPERRLAYEQCYLLWSSVGALGADASIRAELAEARKPQRVRRSRIGRYAACAAAVMVVALGVLLVAREAPVHYETGVGEQRMVRLEDGSTLMLNTNSRISVDYSRARRSLALKRGEVFFAVAEDAERPFVVAAAGGQVRALGTAFNVGLSRGEVTVAVTSGQVEVGMLASPWVVPVQLEPGYGVRFEADSDKARLRAEPVDLKRITAWQANRLYFDNDRLEHAVAEYNRYTNRQIVLVGPDLAQERISGVFDIGDSDALIFAMEKSLGARVIANDRRILVLSEQ